MFDSLTKKVNKNSSIIANYDNRIFLIFCIVTSLLIVDDMFHWVSDMIVPVLISPPSIFIFSVITFVCTAGQYFLLRFVRSGSKEIKSKDSHIKSIDKIVTAVQYILIAIAIFVLLEILLTFQYHTFFLTAVTAIITITTVGVLGLFAYKLFSWFKLNRNSVIVLLYGLSFSIYLFATVIEKTRGAYLLSLKDALVNAKSPVIFPYDYLEPGSFLDNLFTAYTYIDLAAFILLTCATAILLHHYSRRLGRVKFWTVVTLPLLYNASTILETIGVYTPATDAEWLYWWLYLSLNATAGGILFGLAFMTIARTLREDSNVRQYMTITAYGLILMFITDQITLVGASYPPYGLVTLSFKPLASYMIFLGIYSTAISISQDNSLRRSIKKIVTQDSNLLGSIGTAQMEQEIQRTVNSMKDVVQEQEKELEEQTGIEANLEEDEMKNYLEEVMQEVGKSKKPQP